MHLVGTRILPDILVRLTHGQSIELTDDLSFDHKFVPSSGSKTTILALHGTGGDEEDLIPLANEISPNSGILSPRGKVLENGMPRFFRRLAEGVFDIEDLKFRTGELADFAVDASKKYHFDNSRIVAVGYSNGANIASAMLLLRPDSLAGAILFRPMLPLVPEKHNDLSSKKILISSGEYDQIIPKIKVEELYQILKDSKASVEIKWNPSNHALIDLEIKNARDFFARSNF